jgi:mannose-1-phosphate guanylyltransferase/mannose-6-phosphate isomerase
MFVLRASTWLKALAQFRPDIAESARLSWSEKTSDAQFIRPDAAAFANIPADSIDYAVMEKCPGSAFDIRMIPLAAGWNDLGAWDAVWQVGKQDAQANVTYGDVIQTNSSNSLIYSSSRLVSTVGIDHLVVVETPDAVLVADRRQSQDVKAIVAQLTQQGRQEHTLHRKVYRPWAGMTALMRGTLQGQTHTG